MVDLKANPFFLSDEDIAWVENTITGMSDEEKLGQLFCLIGRSDDQEQLKEMLEKHSPGGLMCRPMPLEGVVGVNSYLQSNSKIPMLIAANLERGGNGICTDGTSLGSEMLVGATADPQSAYKLGAVCGREGAAVGGNWSFSPIIDHDMNWRNPITNVRAFSSKPELVRDMGVSYVKGCQENGVAACIKHFPGDGVDERDHHLVTSINHLSVEEWDATYGAAYKASIDAGALSCMIGHIMQPAYSRKLVPGIKDEELLPASLSHELVTTLLREQLGFNGLIVTDASTMAGMVIPMPRSQGVPQSIAAGCDMFLFTRSIEEDYAYMRKGIEDGIITPERLDDCLHRILGMKAALKLHKKREQGTLVPTVDGAKKVIGIAEHKGWASEIADKGITLVKNKQEGILPLCPKKYKKVLFYDINNGTGVAYSADASAPGRFLELFRKEGFEVDVFQPSAGMEGMMRPYSDVTDNYDLLFYFANLTTKSNQTTVRIEWAQPMGANVPIFMTSVPTVFVSVENPYHLIDVPRVPVFINTYASSQPVIEQLIEKLMGRSEFKGENPVDPFCGTWDTKL